MDIININETSLACIFDETIDPKVNEQVIQLEQAVSQANIDGIVEMVVSYNTLVLYFNDNITTHEQLTEQIKALPLQEAKERSKRIFVIPVCYDEKYALDLKELSDYHNISPDEVIAIHTNQTYLIYMLGFMPGFPFLGGLDKRIAMPRRKQPRQLIPAGSVGIAGEQTGMYPLDSPGGWNIIGRTPLVLFDSHRTPEVYYSAGDYIKFKAITADEYKEIEAQVAEGSYNVEVVEE